MKILLLIIYISLNLGCTTSNVDENMKTKEISAMIKDNDILGIRNAIENGLDVNLKNNKNESLLLIATQNKRFEIAKLLVENGADVNMQANNLDSPFLLSGATGQTELVKLFLENGARFDLFNRYYGTALIPACERGHVETVFVLASTKDFPINHVNKLGWTALMEAVVLGDGTEKYQKIIKILLDNKADKNIPDFDGISALEHAKKRKQHKIVDLLKS